MYGGKGVLLEGYRNGLAVIVIEEGEERYLCAEIDLCREVV